MKETEKQSVEEFLKKCDVNPLEKIDTSQDNFWTLKDLLEHYLEYIQTQSVSDEEMLPTELEMASSVTDIQLHPLIDGRVSFSTVDKIINLYRTYLIRVMRNKLNKSE